MAWQSISLAARLVWRRLGILVLANVLWLLLSLLVVTWPAATVGLFALVRRLVQEELDGEPREAVIGDFWDGFRAHWARGSLFTALDLAGTIAIAVALVFYGGSAAVQALWLVGPIGLIGLAWLGAQTFCFPLLLQRPDLHSLAILRNALLIAIAYPLPTLSLLVTSLVLLVAAIALAGPVLLIFFSAMAVLQTVALRQLLVHRGEIGEIHHDGS